MRDGPVVGARAAPAGGSNFVDSACTRSYTAQMRTFIVTAAVLGALGWARPAHAQFQNHSFGLSLGGLYTDPTIGFKPALLPPALAIDATVYVESGFDVGLRFGIAIQSERAPAGQHAHQTVILYPAAMLRYFLWQDYFTPYIGANLEYMHAFDAGSINVTSDNYVGLGPTIGFDYFFAEDWSIGLNGEFAGYFALNAGAHYSAQLWARLATHF